MALHRDIFWIGRQWAVTGSGLQMIDQRLKGVFDIQIERLWEAELVQRIRSMRGINAEEFDKALEKARSRFPPAAPASPVRGTAPVPSNAVVPAFVLRAEGKLARFLTQWRVRR